MICKNVKLMITADILPYEILDGKAIPVPKSLILLALAKARNSDMEDSSLADLIENYLYAFMKGRNIAICTEDKYDDACLSFKSLKQD